MFRERKRTAMGCVISRCTNNIIIKEFEFLLRRMKRIHVDLENESSYILVDLALDPSVIRSRRRSKIQRRQKKLSWQVGEAWLLVWGGED